MKKIFLYMFLGLLLSSNAYAEVLRLKCTYKSIDEQYPGSKVGDTTLWTYDLKDKQYVVSDDYIRFYLVSKILDMHYVHFTEINRYSGKLIFKSAEIPKEEFEELLKLNIYKKQMFEQDEETFYKIKGLTNLWFLKNKTAPLDFIEKPTWIEYELDCEKAKKQF